LAPSQAALDRLHAERQFGTSDLQDRLLTLRVEIMREGGLPQNQFQMTMTRGARQLGIREVPHVREHAVAERLNSKSTYTAAIGVGNVGTSQSKVRRR